MNNTPLIRLHREPAHIRDENTIVVQVLLDEWHPIGYIPGKKVPEVTMHRNGTKITEEKVKNVYQYVPAINDHRYFAHILLTKQGKWGKDKEDYVYNHKYEQFYSVKYLVTEQTTRNIIVHLMG